MEYFILEQDLRYANAAEPKDDLGLFRKIPFQTNQEFAAPLMDDDSELNEIDFIGYQVESASHLNIGDYVTFQKKKLRVAQSAAVMKQGILTFNYTLTLDTGVRQNLILNEKLSGASLPGKVIDREKDTVKVHLDIDQEQPKEEAYLHCKSSSIILDGKTDIQGNRVIIQKASGSQGAQEDWRYRPRLGELCRYPAGDQRPRGSSLLRWDRCSPPL